MTKRLFLFISALIVSCATFSQKMFSGVVVDADTKEKLEHVYIENTTRRIIAESNRSGYFEIFAHNGDTLVFSSIGYYWAKHVVTNENNLTFHLNQQIYEIGLITKMFPYSYEELTNRVLHMKPTEDSLNLHWEHEPFLGTNNHQPGQLTYTINGAITEFYNANNRHARNAIKAAELLSHKENILVMNRKFNKTMVKEMTHVPDEYFDKFIVFCDFSDDFLLNTSDFQIIMTICWKYERFLDENPELKNSLN